MGRLFAGERELNEADIVRLLSSHEWGLSEQEIADLLCWERRTVNNYLRIMASKGVIYKEGRLWLLEQ